jgi:hypothetical protein
MSSNRKSEDERAYRIAFIINDCHIVLANVYENLVDREFVSADKDLRLVISELRLILKSIEEDDF